MFLKAFLAQASKSSLLLPAYFLYAPNRCNWDPITWEDCTRSCSEGPLSKPVMKGSFLSLLQFTMPGMAASLL